MSDAPLIPAALYGLRTWRSATDDGGEYLIGAYDGTPWPDGGAWLHARCTRSGHAAPDQDCACGIHAWHPRRDSARRVLGTRFEIPGIVEAAGAIEVHEEAFRAQRGRPLALVALPGRNAKLVGRLAERYRAEFVEVSGADALLAWCRERGLGLDAAVVDEILGQDGTQKRHAARRTRRFKDAARIAAALVVAASLLIFGLAFASGPPSPNGVFGRTGWVICPKPKAPAGRAPAAPRPAPAAGAPGSPVTVSSTRGETSRPVRGSCP